MKSKSTNYVKGFSLLEVVVAFSILSVAFMALMASFPFGLAINKGAESATIASDLAQQKMEELLSASYDDISVGAVETKHRLSLDTADYLYNYQREATVGYLDFNLSATSTDNGFKKISVNVYWINAVSKTENFYNLTSLLSQR